jgi:hypothetical protein
LHTTWSGHIAQVGIDPADIKGTVRRHLLYFIARRVHCICSS